MRLLPLLASLLLLVAPVTPPTLAQSTPDCRFVLGFQTLHDLIPATVGPCLDDEQHNPTNGDALQHSANGLLVWRKADNFTAFTDGYTSWVNGPYGVQQRLNTARFAWEANPDGLPVVGAAPTTNGDWPTYHHDPSRDGVAAATPPIGSPQALWQSPILDGSIYAEPLVVGSHVFVATENNTVYSLDVTTGEVVWQTHLGAPVRGASLPCGDIDPVGMTGTPVIDPATGTLYAAGFVQPGQDVLFAIDIATGATLWQRPIDPAGSNPALQGQRGALAFANGTVYVPFGGRDGDCGRYHGLVVGVPATGAGPLSVYQTPTTAGGGIWAPSGLAVDGSGAVYVTTGNGGSSSFDYSDSVIKLSPNLGLLDYFAPQNWAQLSRDDIDLGSVAPSLLDNGLLFQVGKAGVGYLLRTAQLGQIGGEAFSAQVCASGGVFGGVAYAAPYIYVPCGDGMVALQLDGSTPSFSVAWRNNAVHGGAPVVAGGTLWMISRNGTLSGLDPITGQIRSQTAVGASATSFPSLAAAPGRLFVPAGTRLVALG